MHADAGAEARPPARSDADSELISDMPTSQAPEPPEPLIVLVIDDDIRTPMLYEDLLARPGRRIVFAASGAEGLRLLRTLTPAVVLLDVNLGDMTGFELAELMHSNPRLAHVPILFVTGEATSEESRAAGYQLGAVDYLTKPVDTHVLTSKVDVFCSIATNTRVIERQRDELQESDRQLVQANEDLRQLAATDPLTGLLNRREFVRELTMVVEHQKRSGRHHGVAILDLNGFKSINDTYGHIAGDAVLVQSAHRLREIARPYDIAARMGGDEFCLVVLDMADDDDLASLGERLTEQMAAPYTIPSGVIVEAPASIGLTLQRADEPVSIDEVLARADRAMYRAKRTRSGYILAAGGMGQW